MDLTLPPAAERYLAYVEMERFTERMRLFAEASYPVDEAAPWPGETDVVEALRQLFEGYGD